MKIKETMVFDLDPIFKKRKIVNFTHLSIGSGVPIKSIEGLYHNELKSIPDGQIEKLCNFLECNIMDLLSDYKLEKLLDRRKYNSKNTSGVVYFAKAIGGDFDSRIKIGYSYDPIQRMDNLKIQYECEVEVVFYIPTDDAVTLEKLMHKLFREHHYQGEWFDISETDIEILK
jgi:DNA-binding Xre family transcriptional regulator